MLRKLTVEEKAIHQRIEQLFLEIQNLAKEDQEKYRDKMTEAINLMKLQFNKLKIRTNR